MTDRVMGCATSKRVDPGRLVYGSWFGDLGGGELRMLDHLRATAFRPESITVLVNLPGRLMDEIERLGVGAELICWRAGTGYLARQVHWYSAWVTTWWALRRLQADVVVCNTFFDFETTGRIAARQGMPLIWRARADTFPTAKHWQPGRLDRLVAFLNDHVDRILATTVYETTMMLDAGVDARKVHVVRNGVDLARYRGSGGEFALRREFGISAGDFCVSFVARMVPQKGYETFFEAIAMAKSRGVPVKALVAGDTTLLEESPDEYRRSLRREIERLNLGDDVRFLGFREDVETVLKASDVFVLASLKEPFGTTVIEAMAAGRAVIASDLPGPRESIVEGETGLFFPPGDSGALADHLVTLHRNPPTRDAFGAAGRARAEAEFDLRRNVELLDQHCVEAASVSSGRRG